MRNFVGHHVVDNRVVFEYNDVDFVEMPQCTGCGVETFDLVLYTTPGNNGLAYDVAEFVCTDCYIMRCNN